MKDENGLPVPSRQHAHAIDSNRFNHGQLNANAQGRAIRADAKTDFIVQGAFLETKVQEIYLGHYTYESVTSATVRPDPF